jgi:prolyl oligopeptidase
MKTFILFSLAILAGSSMLRAQSDSYLWLEEIEGERALEFVAKQNKATVDRLSKLSEYERIYSKSLEIYNSADKIPYPKVYGQYVYNFWKDKDHLRGIWRRASKQNYVSRNPEWEVLLDLDELSKRDNAKWVFEGVSGLHPTYNLFLVYLSDGGGDAAIVREFDVNKKEFVENGFSVGEAQTGAEYVDENTVLISTDFGKNSLTTSEYPRQVRIWKRGTSLGDAQIIFEGDTTDVEAKGYIVRDNLTNYILIDQDVSTYATHTYAWVNNKLPRLDIPDNHGISAIQNNQLILQLFEDWTVNRTTYKQGSLLSLNFTALVNGKKEIQVVVKPDEFTSIYDVSHTKNRLLVNLLTNVKNELYTYWFSNGKWEKEKVKAPDFGTLEVTSTDEVSDQYFFEFENFLIPTTLFVGDAQEKTFQLCKALPAFFDGTKYRFEQNKATSKYGTLIPYFVVSSNRMDSNGSNPTLLHAYGGFGSSEVPFYSGVIGNTWLENGGVFVLANVRGGGEFGPQWHQAGIKEKKQNTFDDFHAVAEDLISRKITSNKNLGILGGSNGGLLVGVAFTERPELYNAVVCIAPLLDMQRYTKLLGGASWIGEYGEPDKPDEWQYLKKYSPYHNLKKGIKYPEVFFYTSTKDDRVHPGHARKMAAKMIDMGYPIFFYENTEGGHSGSSTNEQRARANALEYSYLWMRLK